MSDSTDQDAYLRKTFPGLKPISGPPSLFTLNGFGLSLAGSRNKDHQTGACIKSHVITLLFIPVFVLGSYVTAPAPDGGYYFLGKIQKSTFAKFWNTFLVLALVGLLTSGLWNAKFNSPNALATKELEAARTELKEGEAIAAAELYLAHLRSDLPKKDEAMSGLKEALRKAMSSKSPGESMDAIKLALDSAELGGEHEPFRIELAAATIPRLDEFAENYRKDTVRLIEEIQKIPDSDLDQNILEGKRRMTLISLMQDHSDDPEWASRMAHIMEKEGQLDEAFDLLDPISGKLGDLEGSRILGQILLQKGQPEKAAKLLETYTGPRIKKWQRAGDRYAKVGESSYNKILARLKNNEGPPSFYKEYEATATDEGKASLVDEYIYEKIKNLPSYLSAIRDYEEASTIVPVIMDLGISELRAGQNSEDPDQRAALLKKAEDRFISLQDTTGGSVESKFFLGQVYFWSGRQDEGRELFEEILKLSNRSVDNLITLAGTYREVGDVTASKELCKEAYQNTRATEEQKSSAASYLALMAGDTKEKVQWLEKIKPRNLTTKTRLAEARGQVLLEDNKNDEAVTYFREAAEGWASLPASSSTMNNAALVEATLFNLTGKISHHENGGKFMERAANLDPNNSIVLENASNFLVTTALMQIIKDQIHPRLVRDGVGLGSLRSLYSDHTSREALLNKLKTNENFIKALAYLDRALLLAPNNSRLYGSAVSLNAYLKNGDALDSILKQAKAAQFNHSQAMIEMKDFLSGSQDEKVRSNVRQANTYQEQLLAEIEDPVAKQSVIVSQVNSRLELFTLGDAIDYENEIAPLEAAMKVAPSTRIQTSLIDARFKHACDAVAAKNPVFKKLVDSARRLTSPQVILILGLTNDAIRPALLDDPHVKNAFNAFLSSEKRFPDSPDGLSVIHSKYFRPDLHSEIQAKYISDTITHQTNEIQEILSGWHPTQIISSAVHHLAKGETAKAAPYLEKAKSFGLHLPD